MNRRQVLLMTAAVPVGAVLAPSTAEAGPGGSTPALTVGVEPLEGGDAAFLPLAPPNANASAGAKLVLRLSITNGESAPVTVTGITFSFPNAAAPSKTMQGVGIVLGNGGVIGSGATRVWSNGKVRLQNNAVVSNQVYLPAQVPPQIRVSISCTGFTSPYQMVLDLTPYQSPRRFPFRVSDMRPAECLATRGDHWANGGASGTQIYAHDVDVEGWAGGSWSRLLPGTDGSQNAHYRVWDLPVRAIANGTVASINDGMPDNLKPGVRPSPTPKPVAGNFVWLVHGGERVLYPHLRNGTVSVQPGDVVSAGQMIGRSGNSGNSSRPHIHLEVRREIAGDFPLRPWTFTNAWLLDVASATPWNPDSPLWLPFNTRGVPNSKVLIWPDASRPAWYPPGWGELTRHAVPIGDYQTVFNQATSSGYRLVWFDGFEVGGKTYVNVIFRPDDGVPWRAYHNLTGAGYQKVFNDLNQHGYRLTNVASYLVGGNVRYAGIWRKESGPAWQAYHGFSTAGHQAEFNKLTAQGYHPVNISVVSPGGSPSFSALYRRESVGGFVANSFITPAQYQAAWNSNAEEGRYLSYLVACQHQEGVRFSAIFQEKLPGSGGVYGKHGLSSAGFQSVFDAQLAQGYLTRVVAGYEQNRKATFAGAWRRP